MRLPVSRGIRGENTGFSHLRAQVNVLDTHPGRSYLTPELTPK